MNLSLTILNVAIEIQNSAIDNGTDKDSLAHKLKGVAGLQDFFRENLHVTNHV